MRTGKPEGHWEVMILLFTQALDERTYKRCTSVIREITRDCVKIFLFESE